MRQIALLALSLLLPGAAPLAASFDCAKAATPVEKMICADAELSSADERLADAYKTALQASLYPAALRQAQQQWLAARDKLDSVEQLRRTYRARIVALDELPIKWRPARQPVTAESARARCIAPPDLMSDRQCKVDEFGAVEGSATLSYQLQSYMDGSLRTDGGSVVFRATGELLTPLAVITVDTAHFNPPRIVASPAGKLLVLDGYMEGTGNFNAGEVLLVDGDALHDIDTTSWLKDLQKRLPAGWGAWKGVYPDYRKFTAQTPLWQSGDGNCCPTAGRATIRLRLDGRRFVIDDVKIVKGMAAAQGDR
jgi:uncharacterized protein